MFLSPDLDQLQCFFFAPHRTGGSRHLWCCSSVWHSISLDRRQNNTSTIAFQRFCDTRDDCRRGVVRPGTVTQQRYRSHEPGAVPYRAVRHGCLFRASTARVVTARHTFTRHVERAVPYHTLPELCQTASVNIVIDSLQMILCE